MGNKSATSSAKKSTFYTEEYTDTSKNENKESTTLLWFDPNIGSRQDTEQTKQQLRHINDYVIFHTDLTECVKFIKSSDKEKIFLITSGSKAKELLPQINTLRQIDSIFIFCIKKNKYEYLNNKYSKIIGIYVNLSELCESIQEQIDLVDKQLQTFSFFDQNQKSTKDLSKQSAEFLWFQLFNHVNARLPRNQQAKQEMIQMCREYYRGNTKELKFIDQFEHDYRSEEAMHWYSKQSFVYKLVNTALRREDINSLHTFRFFIGDLSQSLEREHEKILLSEEQMLSVYRGTKLDKEEFDKLKENEGKLISTNGYLSTSRCRSSALTFARKSTKRMDVISVLFEITCNARQLGKSVIFGDIAQFSEYPEEQEVLFDLNACFRLESIRADGPIQLIRMTATNEGEIITKDYIELIQKETEEKSVAIVFGKLMCNSGEYDKSQKYFEQLLSAPDGEDRAWIEHNIGRALYYKGEWKQAREYYDRAYDRMMNENPARIKDSAHVLNNIGALLHKQEEYDEALKCHRQALEIRENFYPSNHVDIATSLNNIGNILRKQTKYNEALDYHRRALKIKEKCYPSSHVSIATSLNNIGIILKEQGKYDEALEYYQRALKIQEKYYSSGHIDIAQTLSNIGDVLSDQEKYDEALQYYQRLLKMREEYYLSGHVDIAQSLENIGVILNHQGKYNEALEHYQRALQMREKCYPSGHVDTVRGLNNIGNIFYQHKRNHHEALDYYQRALIMLEKYYPTRHVDIAASLNNIGAVLSDKRKYDEALDYYQRALKIREKYYPHDHADIATSHYNIGIILKEREKYDEAFDHYQQALRMQEKYYPDGHMDTAASLNNIGLILDQKKKYGEALGYYQRALEMQEKCYPDGHVEIGISLRNIGACYEDQKTALQYYQRALTIYEKFLPVGHPDRIETERNIRRLTEKK